MCGVTLLDKDIESLGQMTLSEVNDKEIWDDLLNRCQDVDLSQTWAIGAAMQKCNGWQPRRDAIYSQGALIAIAQTLVKKIPILGGVANINGGPLFIKSDKLLIDGLTIQVIRFLHHYWTKQQKLNLSIAPCIKAGAVDQNLLTEMGFKRVYGDPWVPWSSIKVDLSLDGTTVLKNMKGSWRRALGKAQKKGLSIENSNSDRAFKIMLERYDQECNKRGFSHPSPDFVKAVRNASENHKKIQILFAKMDQQRISGLLNIGYGDTCYQLIAWNSSVGKCYDSHRLLLWESLLLAKKMGYRWYDLGGVNEIIRPGVAQFKKGIGGHKYVYIGRFEAVPNTLIAKLLIKMIAIRKNIKI